MQASYLYAACHHASHTHSGIKNKDMWHKELLSRSREQDAAEYTGEAGPRPEILLISIYQFR